jgi:hypothetical protein
MPLAKWSGKSTIEYKQDIIFLEIVGKAKRGAFEIRQNEIWSWFVEFDHSGHISYSLYKIGRLKVNILI